MRVCGSSHASSRPTCTRRLVNSGSSSASSSRTSSSEPGFVGSSVIGGRRMPYGSVKPSGSIASWPVLLVGQPPVHVAQAVLVRHQLDVAGAAVGVELA